MKSLLYTLAFLTALLTLPSCNSNHEEHEQQDHCWHAGDVAETNAQGTLGGMSLDNGSRWMMDDHTRSAFASMASSFPGDDLASRSAEELKAIGAGLQHNITALIQGFTMTGEAHNQLHIVLTGYMAAVNSLAESGGLDDANTIKHYLEEYDEYFE